MYIQDKSTGPLWGRLIKLTNETDTSFPIRRIKKKTSIHSILFVFTSQNIFLFPVLSKYTLSNCIGNKNKMEFSHVMHTANLIGRTDWLVSGPLSGEPEHSIHHATTHFRSTSVAICGVIYRTDRNVNLKIYHSLYNFVLFLFLRDWFACGMAQWLLKICK